jgi:CNT family concentrative nucleoside transporter
MTPSVSVASPDRNLRGLVAGAALALGLLVVVLAESMSTTVRGGIGIVVLMLVVAAFSSNLRAVNWRTVGMGMALQWLMALFILKLSINGWRPGYELFSAISGGVRQFLNFTNAGSQFVFGDLANGEALGRVLPNGFVFAFTALPTIIFVSSFFTVLYYYGVLQFIVRVMARAMMFLMRTSGAETLSSAANVFMGQTEAPIIVKPYIPKMTQSELLAMMFGGMATISGGVMAVYITLGADPVAILTTSVMAAPCGLYLAKILMPETEVPETLGEVSTKVERLHVNAVDAAAAGASDGTLLAINVAAMLIAFLAFIAMFDFLLGAAWPGLTLAAVFAKVFAPAAILMGVPMADVPAVADLLGNKLVANEFVAYV